MAVATLTRVLADRLPLEPPAHAWSDLIDFEPEVGCRTRANLAAYGLAEDVFSLTTDAEGWRGRRPMDQADAIVVGDSFAFGYGVDDDDTFAALVRGVRLKGVGTVAYSMVHVVLWLERLKHRLQGRPVVWLVYLGNDVDRSLRPDYRQYRMPFVRHRAGNWELVTDHVSPDPWPFPEVPTEVVPLARLCTPGPDHDRAMAAVSFLLGRARDACREAGSPLTVLTVPHRAQIDPDRLASLRNFSPQPDSFDPRLLDVAFAERCNELGLAFHPLSEELRPQDYFDRDIHWTPEGHRRVATILERLLTVSPH